MRHEARVRLKFTELGISRLNGSKFLAAVSGNKDKRAVIWDSGCPGLCLHIGVKALQ